jgi:hypothetical protein
VTRPASGWLGAVIAFVPGMIVGAIFGFRAVITVNDPLIFFGVWIGAAVLGGFLSARFGIRFWDAVARLRWFSNYR